MSTGHLTVVGPAATQPGEDMHERVRALKERAEQLASDQLTAVQDTLGHLAYLSGAVSRGGDAFPAGVREFCRQVAEEADFRARTLDAIVERTVK